MSDETPIKEEPTESTPIVFKKKTKKNLRQRRPSTDDEAEQHDEVVPSTSVEEIKERQKLRERTNGVSLVGLALGKKLAPEEEVALKDPFNLKTGGLVNVQALKSGRVKQVEDTYSVDIGTQFSAETNKRDEDEEMMRFIELELQRRKGQLLTDIDGADDDNRYMTPEEAALSALPEHLRQSSSHRSEEMLSNQMLNGIPEVDLGIDAKIRNIEATEDAKHKLMMDHKNKKDGPSHFVPTNMAVNFMQHNRFNLEDPNEPKRRKRDPNGPHQVGPNGVKRATDDYHYDKFRKQYRRY